jgi:two-component system, NtrC family, nitrogen regulation sensor histidine kinase NtrY
LRWIKIFVRKKPYSKNLLTMKKRLYLFAALSVLFFSLAFWQEERNTKEINLQQYTQQIQRTLKYHEQEVNNVCKTLQEHPEYWSAQDAFQKSTPNFEVLSKQPFTLLLFQNGKLSAWSNNRFMAMPTIKAGFQELDAGYYEVLKKDFSAEVQLIALIPLKWRYKIDNKDYLKNAFIADECIPENVEIGKNTSVFEVKSGQGESCFLQGKGDVSNSNLQYRLFILFIVGIFFLALLINHVAQELMKRHRPEYGLAFFFLAVVGVKCLLTYIDPDVHFSLLPLFEYNISDPSILSTSPGDMLVNIFLLLWLIVFFYRDVHPLEWQKLPLRGRLVLLFLFYLAIVLGLLITVYFHKGLVINGKEDFDFENIYYIKFSGLITVMSLLMLWVVIFLFNYRIMKNAKRLEIEQGYRIGILLAVIVLVIPMLPYYDFDLNIPIFAAFLFLFILCLDFFIDSESSSFLWLLIWLIVFSGTSTGLLYQYRRISDITELKSSIQKLAYGKDTNALEHLNQIVTELKSRRDTMTTQPQVFQNLSRVFNHDNYLYDNYQFSMSDSLILGTTTTARAIPDAKGTLIYSAQIPMDSLHFYRIEVAKPEKNTISDKEYEETILSEPYLNIKFFDKIDYAIFKNQECIEQKGNFYSKTEQLKKIPSLNNIEEVNWTSTETEVVGRFENDTIIVAKQKYDGRKKVIFLFAYLFVLLAGIAFFIVVLNTFFNFIDGFKSPKHWTINFKVHATIIGLVIFACIVVACITLIYSGESTEKRHDEQLDQKISAIVKDVEYQISKNGTENIDYEKLLKPLVDIHQIDVNFYSTSGLLLASANKTIFKKSLKAPMLHSLAFERLKNKPYDSFKLNDQIGNFSYKSGFATIFNNGNPVALVELPYYSRELLKQNDLSDLMGMLMTVYVLLLLPTIMFAYSTTKVIMKPLEEVGEKLREVGLGIAPTKIEWNSKDELGDLIGEYNAMLVKLDKAARALESSAKEDAWRVMAKQVAHDIRNPLTPFKLCVQMLGMMAQSQDHESLVKYIQKSTRTLEEQIDHLDKIANNFADYALDKDNQLHLEDLDYNDFVEVIADLFTTNEHPNTIVNIVVPTQKLYVKIDRTQMTRVLNNLIKNAIQAIPDNREGRVDVFVYEQGDKVVTRISDNGVGIPQDQMEKIFLPNFTTKGTGSGIGLAISNRIVKDVKGFLWCESVLGQGSDFFIELPRELGR